MKKFKKKKKKLVVKKGRKYQKQKNKYVYIYMQKILIYLDKIVFKGVSMLKKRDNCLILRGWILLYKEVVRTFMRKEEKIGNF